MEERNQQKKTDVQQAQRAVNKSLSAFEGAMDDLAQAIGEAGSVIHNIMGYAKGPMEELKMLGEKVKSFVNDVKKNPQPYALALGAALAYIGYRSWQKREMRAPTFGTDAAY